MNPLDPVKMQIQFSGPGVGPGLLHFSLGPVHISAFVPWLSMSLDPQRSNV